MHKIRYGITRFYEFSLAIRSYTALLTALYAGVLIGSSIVMDDAGIGVVDFFFRLAVHYPTLIVIFFFLTKWSNSLSSICFWRQKRGGYVVVIKDNVGFAELQSMLVPYNRYKLRLIDDNLDPHYLCYEVRFVHIDEKFDFTLRHGSSIAY